MKTHAKHMVSTEFRARRIARTARVSALLSAVLLALLPALVGCTKEPFGEGPDAPDSGSRTEGMIQLDAAVPESDLRTRADAFENTAVRELWVGVYDITTGNRVGAAHFTSWPSSPVTLPVLYYDQHPTVAIVGVANYANQHDWDGNALSDQLDAADTWNKFVDLNVRPALVDGAPAVDPAAQAQIMMGVLTDDTQQRAFFKKSDDGKVSIVTADNATGTIDPNDEACTFRVKLTGSDIYGSMIKKVEGKQIQLRRLFAQVNVTVKSGNDNISVTNVSYRRGNMPLAVYLAERPTWAGTANEIKTWNTYENNTPNFADTKMTASGGYITNSDSYYTDQAWIAGNRDNTFSFAHYENKHWGVKTDNGTSNSHQEREAYTTNQSFEGMNVLDFLSHQYNNFASYFVVRMSVLDKPNNRSAIVEYVIHEGNINNVYGQEGDPNLSNNRQAYYRGNDFSAFRNINYNYTITVNGISDIVSNITTNNHHNGQSGTIWAMEDHNSNNSTFVTFRIDGPGLYNGGGGKPENDKLVMRFYISQGPDEDPLDYISLPEGIKIEDLKGIYWPTIGEYTKINPEQIDPKFEGKFVYRKESWWGFGGYVYNIYDTVADARQYGGNYEFTFNPPTTSPQFDPENWKMGIYYYNPDEVGSLNEKVDPDGCSRYENKIVHIVEWQPAQRQAENLKLNGSIPSYNNELTKFAAPGAEISLTNISILSASNTAVDANDYQLYVKINGYEIPVDSNNKCIIPWSILNNLGANRQYTYEVYAKSLNLGLYKDSDSLSASFKFTTTNPSWDIKGDGDNISSYDFGNGLKYNAGSGSKFGSDSNGGTYLQAGGKGSATSRYFSITLYASCKITIEYCSNTNNSDPRKVTVQAGDDVITDDLGSSSNSTLRTFSTNLTITEGTEVKIYPDADVRFYEISLSDPQ